MASDYGDSGMGTKLKVFNGNQDDWEDWGDRFMALASKRGVVDRIGTTRPEDPEAAAAWDKDNSKLYFALIEFTEGAAFGMVKQSHRVHGGGSVRHG